MTSKKDTIDLVFSFDTTGSMYPCIAQVRRNVQEIVKELFKQITDLRIGIISHGDYCDGKNVINSLDLTNDQAEICRFIRNAPNTDGGDTDECYELVLHHAREFKWTAGRNKALVMIGDAEPHRVGYCYGGKVNDLDWKNERDLLTEAGINIYPIQALGRRRGSNFWKALAKNSENIKLDLPQFRDVVDLLTALCYHRAGKTKKVDEVLRRSRHNMKITIHKLTGGRSIVSIEPDTGSRRRKSKKRVGARLDGRFQVLDVDRDCSIRDFVEENGLTFSKGRGFYQFTKPVNIQEYKEVIAEDKFDGSILTNGDARDVLGIPEGRCRSRPEAGSDYVGYVQSTSVNRKLLKGTKFLYEVPDWEV